MVAVSRIYSLSTRVSRREEKLNTFIGLPLLLKLHYMVLMRTSATCTVVYLLPPMGTSGVVFNTFGV